MVVEGEGNGNAANWREALPEDIRSAPTFAKYDSPEKAHRAHLELERHVGKLSMPKDDAAPEAWEAYYSTRRPQSPDDYGIKAPEGGDEEAAKWFAQKAHARGLDKRQAAGIFQDYVNEYQKGLTDRFAGELQKGFDELVRSWGSDAEKRQGAAARAMSALGVTDTLREFQIEKHPALLKAFAEIGMQMAEDAAPAGGSSGPSTEALDLEIQKIRMSPEYHSLDWDTRQAAIRKMTDLETKRFAAQGGK